MSTTSLDPRDVPLSLSSAFFSSNRQPSFSPSIERFNKLHECAQEYERKVSENSWGCTPLKVNEVVLNTIFGTVSQVPGLGVGASLLQTANSQLHSYLYAECEKQISDRALQFTASCIDNLKTPSLDQQILKVKVFQQAFDLTRESPETRPLVLYHMSKVLEEKFDALVASSARSTVEEQDGSKHLKAFKDLKNSCEGVQEFTKEVALQTHASLGKVGQLTSEIHKDLVELKATTNQQQFVAAFIWKKMSPKEQIDAIRSGAVSVTEEQKKQIELLEKQQEFKETVVKTLDTASRVMEIVGKFADKIGIPKEVVSIGQKAVSVGGIAVNILTGNFLGALSALGSLFSGPDPAEERHKMVMDKLGELQKGQEQILNGQQQIHQDMIKGFNQVLQAQQQTHRDMMMGFNKILKQQLETTREIKRLGQEVMQSIASMDLHLFRIETHLADLRGKEIGSAKEFLKGRKIYTKHKLYTSQEALLTHLQNKENMRDLQTGIQELRSLFRFRKMNVSPIPSPLLISATSCTIKQTPDEQLPINSELLQDSYNSVVTYISEFSRSKLGREFPIVPAQDLKKFSYLVMPCHSILELEEKLAGFGKLNDLFSSQSSFQSQLDFFSHFTLKKEDLLNPITLYYYVKWYCELTPYRLLTRGDTEVDLHKIYDHLRDIRHKSRVKEDLKNVRDIVDLAIIQLTLISGDFLLDSLAFVLFDMLKNYTWFVSAWAPYFQQMWLHLVDSKTNRLKNPYLEANLSLYLQSLMDKNNMIICEHNRSIMNNRHIDDRAYHRPCSRFPRGAYIIKSPDISSRTNTSRSYLENIPHFYIPIPPVESVKQGLITYPKFKSRDNKIYSIEQLLKLKLLIGQTLMDIDAYDQLSETNQKLLADVQGRGLLLLGE